jgi:hypothetical protein
MWLEVEPLLKRVLVAVGAGEWQALENGRGQPIWLGTLLAGKSLLGAVCSWKDSPGSSLLLGTVCSREQFLWNSFLGALSRDFRPREKSTPTIHPHKCSYLQASTGSL